MSECGERFVRVIDVVDLGQRGMVIDTPSMTILLLDAYLSYDERMEIMSAVMGLAA